MNLELITDDEANDVIQKRVDQHNANRAKGEPELNAQQYCERVMALAVASWKKADYDAAVKRLGEQVAHLSYAQRKALIAQVEQANE